MVSVSVSVTVSVFDFVSVISLSLSLYLSTFLSIHVYVCHSVWHLSLCSVFWALAFSPPPPPRHRSSSSSSSLSIVSRLSKYISLALSLYLSLSLSLSHSLSFSLILSHSLSFSLISLSFSLILSHSLTHSLSLTLSLILSVRVFLSGLSLSFFLSFFLSLSLSFFLSFFLSVLPCLSHPVSLTWSVSISLTLSVLLCLGHSVCLILSVSRCLSHYLCLFCLPVCPGISLVFVPLPPASQRLIPVFFLSLSPSMFDFLVFLCLSLPSLFCFSAFVCLSVYLVLSLLHESLSLLVPTTGRNSRQTERAGSLKRRGRATQRETEIELSLAEAMKSLAFFSPQDPCFFRLKALVFLPIPCFFLRLLYSARNHRFFGSKKRGFRTWNATFSRKTPCFLEVFKRGFLIFFFFESLVFWQKKSKDWRVRVFTLSNCESQLWGNSRKSLRRYENRGLLRIDSLESIRVNHPDSRCESPGHLSSNLAVLKTLRDSEVLCRSIFTTPSIFT